MKNLIYIILIGIFWACSPEDTMEPVCVDGSCDAKFYIDELVQPDAYQDNNGYWHIFYYGPKYFTIRGELDEVNAVINGVPLIETQYDSDYWIALNNLRFTVPTYSVLSWFTGGGFNNPIPVGSIEYTLSDIVQIMPPLNIAGYQIQKNFCWECPYAESLLGTYSKYNYEPRQQMFLDDEMVGDTLQVFMKTTFNNDVGPREIVEKSFKIIVE
jgi:hypothetical protein